MDSEMFLFATPKISDTTSRCHHRPVNVLGCNRYSNASCAVQYLGADLYHNNPHQINERVPRGVCLSITDLPTQLTRSQSAAGSKPEPVELRAERRGKGGYNWWCLWILGLQTRCFSPLLFISWIADCCVLCEMSKKCEKHCFYPSKCSKL